jgi:AdoMet-dependent heme synthase
MTHYPHNSKTSNQGRDRLVLPGTLRMVAWEVTRSCNLACVHCRASSVHGPYEGELDTGRCLRLLDEIAAFSRPVIILTGGEPLLRPDIFEIAAYGDSKGLRMVMATNGTLVDDGTAIKIREAGIRRVSISLDGVDAGRHDAFRQVPGAFEGALAGIEALKRAGVEFQVNTTITRMNLDQIGAARAGPESRRGGAPHLSPCPDGPWQGNGPPGHLAG